VLKAMLLTKLKVASWAVGVALLVGAGAAGVTLRAQAQDAPARALQKTYAAQAAALAAQPKARAASDDLESLRLEIEALRRELRATKDMVKALQAEVRGKKDAELKRESTLDMLKKVEAQRLEAEKLQRLEALRLEGENRQRLDAQKLEAEKLRRLEALWRAEAAKAGWSRKEALNTLAELEDAVKRLRQDPKDKQAAEALDRALRRLKERKVPDGTSEERP
jgi:hypothetical protein